MRHFHKFLLAAALAATSPVLASSVLAAEQPDAGRTLQDMRSAPSLPKAAKPLSLETPKGERAAPGGARVAVKGLAISGNTIFDTATLATASGFAQGRTYDFAGLEGLADAITAYYHAHGYPFARAYLPAQSSGGGALKIEVVEGRYGKVSIEEGDARAAAAEAFLIPLKNGDVIEGGELERVSLILDDQPGYSFVPVIRPGQENGTGDLAFGMKRDQRFGGSVGTDNSGNRYTGRRRGLVSAYANSPFLFGDQLIASGIYTEENMWFGSLGYNLPIGTSGLRGSVGYSRTSYELGKTFSSLDAHGTADVVSAGVTYPIIRSQKANLSVGATYNHKWLTDEQGAAGTVDKKTSNTLPVALNFDRRDTLFGGGVTYGMASWTHGIMDLDSGLKAADMTTAHTDGAFDKFNLDVARVQATPLTGLSVYGRFSGQWAADNLDSSEDFGLGGTNGVRAYPTGEAYGDEGWLGQAEIRYTIQDFTPYAFYDHGRVKTNHKPWATGDNHRGIAGAGVGVRYAHAGWNADASAAWRTQGGDPQSDDKNNTPLVWVNVGYSF